MTLPASHAARPPATLRYGRLAGARVRPDAAIQSVLGALSGFWRRRSIRARLLITFVAINAIAGLVAGGLTVVQARKSTRVEIAASMRLAEVLISEMATLLRHEGAAEQFLRDLPSQLRLVRHVRPSVRDAAGAPVAGTAAGREEDNHAPAWFAALIAPAAETRQVPVTVNGTLIGSVLVTSAPGDEIAEVWDNTLDLGLITLMVNLAVVGALYLLFGRVLDPLTSLAAGLTDLERRNYRVRLPRPQALELAEITDRFNVLAAALDKVRADNARLGNHLITAQDDERRRTALELHDEVGPSLFGLKANAASIARAAENLGPAAGTMPDAARDMLAIIEHLQTINRSMLSRLRPMALGHIPLADLASQAVQEHGRRHPAAAVSFSTGALAAGYGDSIDLTIYRCVQEGLTNVVRHAGAAKVAIELGEVDQCSAVEPDGGAHLRLMIRDDGRGIAAGAPMGRGLTGMQERVQALAGTFAIERIAAGGTRLHIAIPLPARAGEAGDDGAAQG